VAHYLKNYDGLMYKMTRMEAHHVSLEVVEMVEKKLESIHKSFTEPTSSDFLVNCEYIALYAWT